MTRRPSILLLSACLLLAVACNAGGEVEPTPTATAEPTPTATPEPTPTATEVPPNVFGTFEVAFIPYGEKAVLPEPPVNVTLTIERVGGGTEFEQLVTVFGGDFSLSLTPGRYQVTLLTVSAPSMSKNSFPLGTGGPAFVVPDAGCVYTGRISYRYYRLAAGAIAEQRAQVGQLAEEVGRFVDDVWEEVHFTPLVAGGVVGGPGSAEVSLPGEGEPRPIGAENCATQLAQFQ